MKYVVTIGTRDFEVIVDGDTVQVDGVPHQATVRRLADSPEYRLALGDTNRRIAVDRRTDAGWTLVLDGTVHEVGILDERTRHIRSLAGAGGAAAGSATVKAPMPGLLIKQLVAVGDRVAQGQGLVVLEAMKMENELRAPIGGVVMALHGAPGDAIEKGMVLAELASQD